MDCGNVDDEAALRAWWGKEQIGVFLRFVYIPFCALAQWCSFFKHIFPCASSILPALSFSIWQFLPRCVRGDPAHYIAWGREILRKKSHIAISTFKYRLTGIHSMFVLNFYFLSGTKAMEETKAQCHVTSTIMQKYCSGGHQYFGKLVNKYFHILWQHISNIANV